MRPAPFSRALALTTAVFVAACGDAASSSGAASAGAASAGAASAGAASAADTVVAPADPMPALASPDFADGAINEVAFEGSYACDPGFAPEITLSDDGTTKVFTAYLHQRLFTSGTWSWDGTTLRIVTTSGSFAFSEIELGDGTMVLGRGEARWACRNLPTVTP
jgi:hypothetical protein